MPHSLIFIEHTKKNPWTFKKFYFVRNCYFNKCLFANLTESVQHIKNVYLPSVHCRIKPWTEQVLRSLIQYQLKKTITVINIFKPYHVQAWGNPTWTTNVHPYRPMILWPIWSIRRPIHFLFPWLLVVGSSQQTKCPGNM